MKTNFFLLLLVCAYAIAATTSCKKIDISKPKVDTTFVSNTGVPTMADFFTQTRVASQSFSGNAGNYIYIVGIKGTQITIPGNSLIHINGTPVTGTVQFELKEIYSNGDMILSNATTTSNGTMLQSGGEIYFNATQNNEQLRINHNSPLQVIYPGSNTPQYGMQLFTGGFVENPNVAADSIMNWNAVNLDTAGLVLDSSRGGTYGYSFVVDSFGWSNCDRFYNLPGGTDPMVLLPAGYTNINTTVYMIFDNEHSVATSDVYANQVCRFHSGTHTPLGLNVTIVAIAKIGNNYYYDIVPEVTASGAVFDVTMTKSTLIAIKNAVDAL